jgi:hypothetical protein
MRFYPDVPRQRWTTLARDVLVLALLALFAWLAVAVHDAVDSLAVLGEGVEAAGTSVEDRFATAADAVADVPVVGGPVGDALRGAGEGTGGNVAEVGREGTDRVHRLADLLGAVTFLIPALLLLVGTLPERVGQIRRLTAASRVLHAEDEERTRLLAMRAAFSLPYGQLLRYSEDPFGDLAAGRHAALAAAAYDDAGIRPRR